ncbi:uncharacterized protein BXZ73DRAFT_109120 [Epithele typhae]|uniref:uncharacterized protein n=1 Tax=Epithele typhae TaxID=378194 RepID=UPI0020077A70|nr:uncharacterized protein BXZ73DRAFT_109120 [Epithele typhae]KAH9910357.1 hypothetical protein BXZ73DRAFT_109120 [Epithele typhae]
MLDLRLGWHRRTGYTLADAFTPLVEGVLDHTEAAVAALMDATCARASHAIASSSSTTPVSRHLHQRRHHDATTLIEFDSDTRPPSRTLVDGPERWRRYSSSCVAHTPAGAPCREVLGDEAGGVERYELQHCGAGTAFERVSGTGTDVDIDVKPATLTDPALVQKSLLDSTLADGMYIDVGDVLLVRVNADEYMTMSLDQPKAHEGVQQARGGWRYLPLDQSSIPLAGRAFGSRLCAENPRNFLPDSGQLAYLSTPPPTRIFTVPPGVHCMPLAERSSPFTPAANTSVVIAPSLRVERGFDHGFF